MAAATKLTGSIMSAAEVLAILAKIAGVGDELRRSFTALTQVDQETCCCQATAEFNACWWEGEQTDGTQEHAFPRIGFTQLETEAAIPAGAAFTAWSYTAIPWNVRAAFALQCGHRARVLGGWADDDAASATQHPWSKLHARAAALLTTFRRGACDAV